MNYVALNSDGTTQVREYEDGKGFKTILEIVGTGQEYDNVDSGKDIARFTTEDVQKVSSKIDKGLIDSLRGNGFLLYAYMHENGRSLYAQGIIQENKYLADRGWKGVYGSVALCAQFEDSETGEPVHVPASGALEMAKIIMESKGKSIDSLYSERGAVWVRDAEMRTWMSEKLAEVKGEGGQVDIEAFVKIQTECRLKFGLDEEVRVGFVPFFPPAWR